MNKYRMLWIWLLALVFVAGSIQAQSVPPTNIDVTLEADDHVSITWFQHSEATQVYLYKKRLGNPTLEFLGAYNVSPGENSWHSGEDQLTRHLAGDEFFIEELIIAEDGTSNQRLGRYGPIKAETTLAFPFTATGE